MTQELKELIQGYIERCIPDIARKCGCTVEEVRSTMHQVTSQVPTITNKVIQVEGHDYTFNELMALFSE